MRTAHRGDARDEFVTGGRVAAVAPAHALHDMG
jgi:hypothetical protein